MNNFVYRRYTYSNYLQDLINPDSPEPVKLMASNFLKKIVHGNVGVVFVKNLNEPAHVRAFKIVRKVYI